MNWKDTLKKLGHENDGAYCGLMTWFDQNPDGRLNTHEMGKLGLRHWLKGRREWSYFNQATLERKARDLRTFGLLESYQDGQYVYFKAKQGLQGNSEPSGAIRKPQIRIEMRENGPVAVYV